MGNIQPEAVFVCFVLVLSANNTEPLQRLEVVVSAWMDQIRQVPTESEQLRREADDVGPSAELEHWKRRMLTFNRSTHFQNALFTFTNARLLCCLHLTLASHNLEITLVKTFLFVSRLQQSDIIHFNVFMFCLVSSNLDFTSSHQFITSVMLIRTCVCVCVSV